MTSRSVMPSTELRPKAAVQRRGRPLRWRGGFLCVIGVDVEGGRRLGGGATHRGDRLVDGAPGAAVVVDVADEVDLGVMGGEILERAERGVPLGGQLGAEPDCDSDRLAALLEDAPGLGVEGEHGVHLPHPSDALLEARRHLLVAGEVEGLADVLHPDRRVDRRQRIAVEVGQVCLEEGLARVGGRDQAGEGDDADPLAGTPAALAIGERVQAGPRVARARTKRVMTPPRRSRRSAP